eukprot:TRINITY_DN11980_c0_g1_i3.p1 TRINITY_DN11980_c0_g1~~TRINITY_DN11980_c0_g1_i3.p1  ORF type:complete len:629 (-),score=102.74 TRINITY_DN11980_c0_g1_i3:158-2044(-)
MAPSSIVAQALVALVGLVNSAAAFHLAPPPTPSHQQNRRFNNRPSVRLRDVLTFRSRDSLRSFQRHTLLHSITLSRRASAHSVAPRAPRPHHALRIAVPAGSTAVDLAEKLRDGLPYLGQTEQAELQRALAVALRVHSDAAGTREGRRRTENAVDMCLVLGELDMDVDALLAAILTGTLNPEQGPLGKAMGVAGASVQDLQRRFGRRVVRLVQSYERVTRLEQLAQRYMAERAAKAKGKVSSEEAAEQLDRLRNLILSETADWRVVILRVASHLQRMRRHDAAAAAGAACVSPRARSEHKALAHEALGVHAPLAHRLGIHQIVAELQDLAFKRLYPRQNAEVRQQMAARTDIHEAVLDRSIADLTSALEQNNAFMAAVESVSLAGRTKDPYSMWRKTIRQGVAVADIADAVALRVVFKARRLPDETDAQYESRSEALCYEAMRIVQDLYPTVTTRFKDYICAPKANGYRSLHTTALMQCDRDPDNVHPFEVQVRTFEMHQQAEYGAAAHWGYKGEGSTEWLASHADSPRARTIGGAPAVPADFVDGRAFVNWLHSELQSRKVYVFGPDGLIWDLDKSATAADVARRVSIANFYSRRMRGRSSVDIMVEGNQVPCDYLLRNGDAISWTD